MSRVEDFKALGEYAILPAVNIGRMIDTALTDAAIAENAGDITEAQDLLEWAEFLETEMRL